MQNELKVLRRNLIDNVDLILSVRGLKQVERLLLIESYCKGLRRNATDRLANELHYSKSSIKRQRRYALEKVYIILEGALKDGS